MLRDSADRSPEKSGQQEIPLFAPLARNRWHGIAQYDQILSFPQPQERQKFRCDLSPESISEHVFPHDL
jgi:hypothetical protein